MEVSPGGRLTVRAGGIETPTLCHPPLDLLQRFALITRQKTCPPLAFQRDFKIFLVPREQALQVREDNGVFDSKSQKRPAKIKFNAVDHAGD